MPSSDKEKKTPQAAQTQKAAPKKAAPKKAAPKKPATKATAAEKKEADAKKEAAKAAAAQAREEAKAKRSRTISGGQTGSIFAAAVAEGVQSPEQAESIFSTGAIFAAALENDAAAGEAAAPPEDGAVAVAQLSGAEETVSPAADGVQVTETTELALLGVVGDVQEQPQESADAQPAGAIPVFKRSADRQKKRKAPKGKRVTTSFPANRGEGGNAVFRAIGGVLYALGFYTECKIVMGWRFVRDLAIFLGQILAWVFGGILRSIGRFFAALIKDFIAPFRKAGHDIAHLGHRHDGENGEPGKEIAVFYPSVAERRKHKVRNIAGVVMPLAALAALVFVVYSIFGIQYGLAVNVNGQTIGYITDRSVLEDAKNILRSKLRLADDAQQMADLQFNPDLEIAKTNVFTSKDGLADRYIESTGTDVVQGTGLVIDGEYVAVTTEGEELAAFLQAKLDAYKETEEDDVSFVKDVQCDPDKDELFFPSKLQQIDELKEMLDSTVTEQVGYTARGEETLQQIAADNGVALETLRADNPDFAAEGDDFVPAAGSELTLSRQQAYLQVKKTVREMRTETIPFETVEQETEDYTRGSRFTTQTGVEGQREAYYDLTYVDGELVSSELVGELTVVLSEPVDEVVMVGTAEPVVVNNPTVANSPAFISGPGNYLFPVPDFLYSSRGTSGGHRGRDINAPHGAPIYASNDGVVIDAGWHYSWGYNVKIQHPDGYTTLYAHASALYVTTGQVVSRGQHIAAIGSTGYSFGDHLHLEVWGPGGGLLDPDQFVVPPRPY